MPIFTKASERWPALVYLGLNSKKARVMIRDALFASAQTSHLDLSTLPKTCHAIADFNTGVDYQSCMQAGRSDRAIVKYHALMKLIEHIYQGNETLSLPIFVFERDGKIIKVVSGADNLQLIVGRTLELTTLADGTQKLSSGVS